MAGTEDVGVVLEEAKSGMERSIHHLRLDLQKIRTGRANPSLLNDLSVDYYGTPTPLNQLASLSAPDPRLIVVSAYDKGSLGAIERAIQTSDLGLTPANDGKVVRVPIPPLTEQRRKELVKHVHKLAEDHKLGIRDARREALALLKDLEKGGGLSADDLRRAEKKVQDLTDEFVKKVDETSSQKEQEILEV